MKKKLTYLVTAALLLVCVAGNVYAQSDNHDVTIDIPTIRLLGVYDDAGASFTGQTLTLQVADPTNPGDSFSNPSDNTLYLRYTVLTLDATPQKITADITGGGAVPTNIDLNVTAAIGGSGAGNQGSSEGQQTIDDAIQDLITGIMSCWTGTGNTDGANLTYEVGLPADPDDLETSNTTHTVTYTIQDE